MATDDSSEEMDRPELRSFGRRRGRKLSPRQKAHFSELLPQVSVDLMRPPGALDLAAELFPGQSLRDVWLEIGFGGGEHLVWQAEHHRDVGVIGCEPYEEGVVKVLAAIDDLALDNIRVHADDARAVLRWLPEASIGRAFVLFPDPWPKKRHVKRRLVNPQTLALLARVMRAGAELRIATDIGDYARTIMIAMQDQRAFAWQARSAGDWHTRSADWPATRYQEKAGREGRRACFLRFRRV